MISLATWSGDIETIMPELGPLTTGLWIYHNREWMYHPENIFLGPSGAALIGFLVNMLAISYGLKVFVTIALIVLLLRFLNSPLAPSFATGLLPVLTNATHWSYIFTVLGFTLILMIAIILRNHPGNGSERTPMSLKHMAIYLVASLIWVTAVGLAGRGQMAGIPPVMVVFFEVLEKPDYNGKLAIRQVLALTGAAAIGVGVHLVVAPWLMAAAISLPLVFGLLSALKLKLPAAYAFPVLALVLPQAMFKMLPLTTILAASFFLGFTVAYRRLAVEPIFASKNN
ncbi:hypothetical protein [Levilactobacillus senmaizukei]|nr:hypothetical protein [Levilactobacillus senmaizukei]